MTVTENDFMLAMARSANPAGPREERVLYQAWAAMVEDPEWTDITPFVGYCRRGLAWQTLYVNGVWAGRARVACDEVSGEIEEAL